MSEKYTMFCPDCNCCLAKTTHCWTCHVRKSIKTLCRCGECEQKLQDYIERDRIVTLKRSVDRELKKEAA